MSETQRLCIEAAYRNILPDKVVDRMIKDNLRRDLAEALRKADNQIIHLRMQDAIAIQEVLNMLYDMKYEDTTTLEKINKDYIAIEDKTSIDKNVLANCLDSLEVFGYGAKDTLYEIEFDLTMLKEKIERIKEDNNIQKNTPEALYEN